MGEVEQQARALAERAVQLGARAAQPLSARAVVTDPRVTLKCRVPLCAGYGRNLMCPPFVPTAPAFAATPSRYTMALAATDVARRYGGKSLDDLSLSPDYQSVLAASQNALDDILTALEGEALA